MSSEKISDTKVQYLSFSAEINTHTSEQFIATVLDAANKGVEEVHIMLSAPGGGVNDALAMYHTLRAVHCKIVTYNVGCVASAAIIVFLSGEERYACPSSTFMFHGVANMVPAGPGQALDEKLLRELSESTRADNERIGSIYQEHMTLDAGGNQEPLR